ncbi:peptide-methionine (R)-S-oxide reductase [Candidatus Pacearchaeota archaeon CG1_02_32_132]|nr:MAG: peptide-methionine (R)-S-oxide reductase [Candidatus Pacearchaeota archaeon CG1_02_32_132]
MKIDKEKLKKKLTPKQYRVIVEKSTELPFTGKLLNNKESGVYSCAACGNVLFDSTTKFDSHCGWPSFYDAKKGAIEFHEDNTLLMKRVEVTCAKCGGHLGHIFDDAPQTPTGKRFCINSVSLAFNKGKLKKK